MRYVILMVVIIFLFLGIKIVSADSMQLIETYDMNDLLTTPNSLTELYIDGITTNSTDFSPDTFWIIDSFNNAIWDLNSSLQNKTIKHGVSSIGSGSPEEITQNNSDFWFLDISDDFVYHLNSSYHNQTDGFNVDLFGAGLTPTTITMNSSNIFMTDYGTAKIFVFNLSGNNDYNISCSNYDDCGYVRSITTVNGSEFWVLESLNDSIIQLDNQGNQIKNWNISFLSPIVDEANLNSFTTSNGRDFWVVHRDNDEIYHINNYTQYPKKNISESFSLSDFISFRRPKQFQRLSESFDLSEYINRPLSSLRKDSESLDTSDFISKIFHSVNKISESISISDLISRLFNAFRTQLEIISIEEFLFYLKEIPKKIISEAINIDTFTERLSISFRKILQFISINEFIYYLKEIPKKLITETLNVADFISRLSISFRKILEILNITEFLYRFKIVTPKYILETININDFIQRLTTTSRTILETLNLNDFIDRIFVSFRKITETLNINDFIKYLREIPKRILETLNISDLISRLASFFRGIFESIGIFPSSTKLADIITYSPRTYIQSIVPGSSLRFNITVRHSLNRTDDFDFTTTSFNFDYFNVTFQYNNLTIGQAEERKIEANITSLTSTPVATYYGNVTINRTRDSSKRNLTLTITVDEYVGNVEIYNSTSLEKCGTGLCSWSVSMQNTETESYKYLVKNTGNWNISLCNASIESASYSESWYSFSPTAFTLEPNNSTNLTLTFTNPPASSYPSTNPQITCVATPSGGEDTLEPSNQDTILLAVSSAPVGAPTGGGPPTEVLPPPEENISLLPNRIIEPYINFKLMFQKNVSYEKYIKSNVILEDVATVNLENFTVELIENGSIVVLRKNIFRGPWFSTTLGGIESSIRVTDKFSRISYVSPIQITVINMGFIIPYINMPIWIFILSVPFIIYFLYRYRKNIKLFFKKRRKEFPFSYPY